MSTATASRPATISPRFVERVRRRLAENLRVRRLLPVWGRLHVDRQLPFLCVYRRPVQSWDQGTERLVTSEAAYLTASARRSLQPGLRALVRGVAEVMVEQFGGFLLLELWSGDLSPVEESDGASSAERPRFRLRLPEEEDLGSLPDRFESALARVRIRNLEAAVELVEGERCSPPRLPVLVDAAAARELGITRIGLVVHPIYHAAASQTHYPLLLRDLQRPFSRALRRTFYEFSRERTTQRPPHFQVLGRRAVVKAVWEVDRQLAEVSNGFDFLLQTTPVNTSAAWRAFRRARFDRRPAFYYRPLPVDPVLAKRKLYQIPLERVEDPALAQLLRGKQDELDRKLTMLLDLNTPNFVHGSIQVFGKVEDSLFALAEEILERIPPRSRDDSKGGHLDAAAFARLAEAEIDYYRQQWPEVRAKVRVRRDIASGLMVSHGSLLIGEETKVPRARAEALLQHEIGTHVLTYYNGRAQPLRQLYSGLARYEELQEGLAVLAEFLAGGLSRPRLRLLAARVVACRLMLDGASFVDTFRHLDRAHDFEQRTAFTITVRLFRGGGLTKDAVYLRGLANLLVYLRKGGKLEPLFVGKIGVEHIPIIEELTWRKVLVPPPLRPRYLEIPKAEARLEKTRAGLEVLDLVKRTEA